MSTSEPSKDSRKPDSHGVSSEVTDDRREFGAKREVGGRSAGFPMRLVGSGMELATYTLLLGAAGYWIDAQRQHSQPYFGVTGALVGFTLGMYRLIVLATRQG